MEVKRVFLIVLDSAGVGWAPDAERFGDVGSDTFGSCVRSGKLHVPNMERMGLYRIQGTSFEKSGISGTALAPAEKKATEMNEAEAGRFDGGADFGKEEKSAAVTGCFGKLREQSAGKDTTMGHWEIAGVISPKPMPTFPHGFPKELLDEFAARTGRGVICNEVGSGTEMIRRYG